MADEQSLQEQIEVLHQEIIVLRDRLEDLEHGVKSIPFIIPTRKRTKVWAFLASVLTTAALVFALSPHQIQVGNWRYDSPGIKLDVITSVAALIGVWATIREHLRDKHDYRTHGGGSKHG
ncbi:MAG: hypothetical protein ACHWZW_03135 [Spirulina sp.]